jgi:hypothetical protein
MTSNRNPHITLIQPGELLASVPHLLGFHPADSLIVVGLRGSRETTISVVLRSDLPPPSGVRALAEYLLVPLTQHKSTSAVMIVVGGVPDAPDGDLPHQELLARCESVLVDGGFPVVHQLWTPDTAGGRRWHCYDEFNCTGIMPDPTSTELAVAASKAGLVTYDRREDIVATLKPEPDEILGRRSTSLDQLADEPESDDSTRAKLNVVQSAIDAAGPTEPTLSDNDVIRLSRALADHRVRDTCLDFDELPDVAAAERLWTALARATPAPERAEPACLLAFSAYARGDGVLAGIALTEAEAADPGHRLSSLLRSALALGLPPGKIRTAGIRAATFARKALTEDRPSTPTNTETPTATRITEPAATTTAAPATPTHTETPAATTNLAAAATETASTVATAQTVPTTPAATELPEPAAAKAEPTPTGATRTTSPLAGTPTATATLAAVAAETASTTAAAAPAEPPSSATAGNPPTPTATIHTAPAVVESPPVEAILAAAPMEVATASSVPLDEPASAALPLPDSPAAATVPASAAPTVDATSSMSACVPAISGPVPAEPSTMEAIVAIAAAEVASSTPDSVPTAESTSTAPVVTESPAAGTIVAAVAPTTTATSVPATTVAALVELPAAGTTPAASVPTCVPAAEPAAIAPVAAEPPAAETIPATPAPTMATTSAPTAAPTAEPRSPNANQTVAPSQAEPTPTAEMAGPTAQAPTSTPTPAEVSTPASKPATTGAPTAAPVDAAPTPAPVTPTALPNSERLSSDIPTEAHQEAS